MRDRKRTRTRWGGRRARAGRKRIVGRRRRVDHRPREDFATLTPLHVTVRLVDGLPTLRTRAMRDILKPAFVAGRERVGFRLIHFSVMSNHMHFIVEAENPTALSRGMQGLLIRIARALNRALIRRGRVFADRFHSRALGSTLDVRNALLYVLNNARKHGIPLSTTLDPYSSALWFHGWREDFARPSHDPPVALPRSWQLVSGFLLHGRLNPLAIPGGFDRLV